MNIRDKYSKEIKYMGECLCKYHFLRSGDLPPIFLPNKIYDYYLDRNNNYWVVYNYDGDFDKQGYRFYVSNYEMENYFDNYFTVDNKVIRKIKLENINGKEI
jgi:hypothetical protein